MIRRASGHLKKEGSNWTFIFLCDPFPDFENSGYISDIPGNSLPPLADWMEGLLSHDTAEPYLDRLRVDGFGFTVKILRDIKSSWKLLLSEMETFLETLVSRRIFFMLTNA